ncbi:hypothetical protein [Neisseria musculi]|uniref:hypothetical protein n=1 Tax=Neisseria musculi TaxID=1815583 RepID=UPI00164A19B6|nr:hypothetical protein [Neisseria musculi]
MRLGLEFSDGLLSEHWPVSRLKGEKYINTLCAPQSGCTPPHSARQAGLGAAPVGFQTAFSQYRPVSRLK